jgi:threonine/homoserine/homoserine lactone efflux protein
MLWSFIVATALITLMPGPSLIVITMTAIDRGLAKSIQTILGVVVADAILLLLALSGVGAIIYASAEAFAALKWLGAIYLIYLGAMQLRSKANGQLVKSGARGSAFVQGLGTTILNPKVIGFLIVYFPQFLNSDENVLKQMVVLGPLFLLVVFSVFLLCALAAKGLRSVLETARGRATSRNVSGLSLIGCGVYSAAS